MKRFVIPMLILVVAVLGFMLAPSPSSDSSGPRGLAGPELVDAIRSGQPHIVRSYEDFVAAQRTIREEDELNKQAALKVVEQADVDMAIGGAADRVIGERLTALPEDGDRWHLTVFTASDGRNPNDRSLLQAFDSQPELQWLKSQTHFHHYHPALRMYSKYRSSLTALPCVVVQDASGKTVYKASGDNLPRDPETLAQHIRWMIGEYNPQLSSCPCGPRPPVQPTVPTTPTGIPDLMPKGPVLAAGTDDLPAAGVVALLSLIVNALYQKRQQMAV